MKHPLALILAVIVAAALTCVPPALSAQTSSNPAFEVASVKPVSQEVFLRRGFGCGFAPGGRFRALGWVRYLIACAYEVQAADLRQAVVNGPNWVESDIFEIDATSPSDHVPKSQSEGLAMFRSLLADRFKLAVHREMRDVPVYSLIVEKSNGELGPQIRQADAECAAWIVNGRRGAPPRGGGELPCEQGMVGRGIIRNSAMTIARLANLLAPSAGRPVQDHTGLTGNFYVDLQWKVDQPGADAVSDSLPTSLFTAVEEQLGLKLQSTRGAVDVLVIDHIERPTAD